MRAGHTLSLIHIFDAAAVAERLNASPREVARLTGAGHLLALFASDDTTVYPLFQFTDIDWRSLGLYPVSYTHLDVYKRQPILH